MRQWIHVLLGLVACGPTPRLAETAHASTEGPTAEPRCAPEPPPARSVDVTEARCTPEPPPTRSVDVTTSENPSVDGWQLLHVQAPGGPVPFMTGVWARAADDLFVVGSDGIILHFDGRIWSAQPTPATEHYTAVWGSSGQVFVAGMDTPEGGLIRHYDGQCWNRQSTPPTRYLNALWGSGVDDVFTVGAQGTIFHYDGHSWQLQRSGTTEDLLGVWGASANDVFAVGHDGTVVTYNGSAWSPQASGTSAHLRGIWGTNGTDVFVVGDELVLHYDGRAWRANATERDFLRAISGSAPADVITVGNSGVILSFDGQRWNRNLRRPAGIVHSPTGYRHFVDTRFTIDLRSVWTTGPNHFIAVGRGTIMMHLGAP